MSTQTIHAIDMNYRTYCPDILMDMQANEYAQCNYCWPNGSSLSLKALQRSTFQYNNRTTNLYQLIPMLCNLLIENPKKTIWFAYNYTITNENKTETIRDIKNLITQNNNESKWYIDIIYIAKGKSFLKNELNEFTSIPTLEAQLKEKPNDYLKIIPRTNVENETIVTVITDNPTEKLIQGILVYLPIIYRFAGLLPWPDIAEPDPKTKALDDICAYLAECREMPHPEEGITPILNKLKELLTIFTEKFNLKNTIYDKFVKNLTTITEKTYRNNISRNLNEKKANKEEYESRLTNLYREIHDLELRLQTYTTEENTELADELKTFLEKNDAFEILSTTNDTATIRITAPFRWFIPEDLETYNKNKQCDYWRHMKDSPIGQKIMNKIFITQEYQLITQAVVKLRIRDNGNIEFDASSEAARYTELPNPHLFYHNCWSSAKIEIRKALENNNFIAAFTQLLVAVQSINIAEHTSFVSDLLTELGFHNGWTAPWTDCTHVIDTKTGTKYTWKEIIEKETKEANETNKTNAE